MNNTGLRILVTGIALSIGSVMAAPLGTAFTYQGQLSDGGLPATGAYDLQFRLFDAATAGAQIGSTVLKGDVAVAGGQFTVSLDFGATPFAGQARFLEIGVRPGASTGAYTLLGARQELTPSPNALFASSAASATTVAGLTCTNNQVAKWSGSAWTCGADSNSGGTVTNIATGSGLSGGPITGSGTLSIATAGITSAMIANGAVGASQIANGAVGSAQVNTAQVQARVSGTCGAGFAVKNVNSDGTVVCASTTEPLFSLNTLDGSGTVGSFTSIAIGTDGLGLISYQDWSNEDLKVAHCSDPSCSSATITTLDTSAVTETAIAIGADGLGLIAYISNGNLKVAHCSNLACTSATMTTLDPIVARYPAITIGADGLGLISYSDETNYNLKVAHCSNATCSAATISTLDSAGAVGRFTAITTGAIGLGLISYADSTNGTLKVAFCQNAACTSSTNTPIATAAVVDTAIAIGSDNLALIAYRDDGPLKTAHCSNQACTLSTTAVLEIVGGAFVSLAIGTDGRGLISYTDNYGPSNLKVAHCSDVACTTATQSTIDSGGYYPGQWNSLAIGADGFGLISYIDNTGYGVKIAHCSNTPCTPFATGVAGVTSVTAGAGLSGGTVSSSGTLSVDFAGSGSSSSVARSDHNHLGQSWSGTNPFALALGSPNTAGSRFALFNTSAGGKEWDLISSGSTSAEGAGKLVLRSETDLRTVMTLQGDGNVGIGTSQPAAPLDLSLGTYRLQFRNEGGLVPGLNLAGTGGNVGVLRLRRKMEIWPNDAATGAGGLDIRNTAGGVTIDLNGTAGTASFSGTVSKGGGSFKIDHPLDPENKFLYHSFVESPDMMNIYNGNVTTDEKGYATVVMPAWFQALNRDFRYQLTVVDEDDTDVFVQAKVVRKIAANQFTIRASAPGVEISWLVTGIRQDAFANANRIPLEEMKPAEARGTYLHPAAFGREPKK